MKNPKWASALFLLYFAQAFAQSGKYTIWHNVLNLIPAGSNAPNLNIINTGDPGIFPNIATKQAGGDQSISLGLTMPGNVHMDSLILYYRVSNSATFIANVRLDKIISALGSMNLLDHDAILNSTATGKHVYALSVLQSGNVTGPIVVSCKLYFADIAHYVSIAAIGIVVTPLQTNVLVEQNTPEYPESFALAQNFPNPFNPNTHIEYTLPSQGQPVIRIYNSLGQLVRRLEEPLKSAGAHRVLWDGKDDHGQTVVSGQYYYQMQAGEYMATKRMLMIK